MSMDAEVDLRITSCVSKFGNVLKSLRAERGLTQQQLADRVGIAVSIIGRLETKPGVDPRLSTLYRLAAALGCRVSDLTGD